MQIMEGAEEQMKGREYSIPSSKVLELCEQSNCSAYDCEFVQLAKDRKVPLVTWDAKIIRSFPKVAVSLVKFVTQ